VPARTPTVNATITAAATLSVPPYRYHLPGVLLAMITLPLDIGMASTNDAMTQPTAGMNAPVVDCIAQAAARQVSKIPAQNSIAPTGDRRLYWKLPIIPCTAPNSSSAQ
jgi:hypothetical protein